MPGQASTAIVPSSAPGVNRALKESSVENFETPKKVALHIVTPEVVKEDALQAIDARDFMKGDEERRIHSVQLAEFSGILHKNLMRMIDAYLDSYENKELEVGSREPTSYVDKWNRTQRGYLLTEKFAYKMLLESDSPHVKSLLLKMNERVVYEYLHLKNLHENFPLVARNMELPKSFIEQSKFLIGGYEDHIITLIFRRCNRVIKSRSASYENASHSLQDVGNRSYDEFRYLRQMRSDALAVHIAIRTQLELVDTYKDWTYETALGLDEKVHSERNSKAWLKKARDADLTLLRESKFPLWAWANSFEENVSSRWESARRKFLSQTTRYDTYCEWKTTCEKMESSIVPVQN